MQLWQEMEREGMEELIFCHDPHSGLKAIIAIHSTALGPALGGCRCWTYASEQDAVRDAMKLAKGMTYKNAISGLPYGGGKAVVWDVPFAQHAKRDDDHPSSQNGEHITKGQCGQSGVSAELDAGVRAETRAKAETGMGVNVGEDADLRTRAEAEARAELDARAGAETGAKAETRMGVNVGEDADLRTRTGTDVSKGQTEPGGLAGVVTARAQRFRALGRCLERLNGRFVTGLDLGTTASDMDQIRVETTYVTDTTGSLGAQDDFTAEMTAYGVYIGIVTSLRHQGVADLQGIPVAVQGLGKVGHALCRRLHAAGARLIVADVVPERVQRALVQFSGAIPADPAHIHAADCKVFAPCALGGVLTPATVEELRCSIVAGAANNQLSERQLVVGRMQARGILYAPDYVLNAGGIISTAYELKGAGPALIRQKVAGIAGTLGKVYAEAVHSAISTADAADQLAESILQSAHKNKK
ncbi:amino acid dehydrogenase [Paenibacillus sp. PCH8]|uniref:Leu/Phe/Val dehydrogenase n=1 Tax=Paenibacillus sp. PCH8 TaxID=2066524 RepID=UPI000CFA26C3|nr:amino acid dehydrogenase [Paenibacillus sp. PCH8]PQP84331.1 amino acid dehydrogenase [Paenibacillus sp. PCH8]